MTSSSSPTPPPLNADDLCYYLPSLEIAIEKDDTEVGSNGKSWGEEEKMKKMMVRLAPLIINAAIVFNKSTILDALEEDGEVGRGGRRWHACCI